MEGLYPGIHEIESGGAGFTSTPAYNSAGYEQFRAHMNRLSYEMQRPDGAKRRKKKKNAEKKLKRHKRLLEFQHERMRELEAEQEQMKQFFQMFAVELSMRQQQRQSQQHSFWWHSLLGIGIGKAFDMGGIALNNWTKKRSMYTLPDKTVSQLMLTDGRDKK